MAHNRECQGVVESADSRRRGRLIRRFRRWPDVTVPPEGATSVVICADRGKSTRAFGSAFHCRLGEQRTSGARPTGISRLGRRGENTTPRENRAQSAPIRTNPRPKSYRVRVTPRLVGFGLTRVQVPSLTPSRLRGPITRPSIRHARLDCRRHVRPRATARATKLLATQGIKTSP